MNFCATDEEPRVSVAGTLFEVVTEPTLSECPSPAAQEAALRARFMASKWARWALTLYASGAELTPDEASNAIDWTHERSIKPRVSNMLKIGWLETTGVRRPFTSWEVRRGPGDVLRITDMGRAMYLLLRGGDPPRPAA